MGNKTELINNLNRREFLLSVLLPAGAVALGWHRGTWAEDRRLSPAPDAGEQVGISNAAYQSASRRAQAMTGQMTLEEKISQLGSQAAAVERLNLPAYNYYTGEALHGLTGGFPVTSFPVPLALAAAWNPDLVRRVYTAVSDEARAYDNRDKGGLSFYSPPTLNLHRDPRWGRCEEAPGEDPCLAATVATQMVLGMQGDNPRYLKTTACSKHFICNNTDDDRTAISANVDPRSFWEYYTRAYRATVREADVFVVMGAYSALDGIPCCADRLLVTDILRRRWGFRGYVTSDCDAIYNIYDPHHYADSVAQAAAMAVQAGCDLNCGGTLQNNLKAAVDQRLIGEEAIGEAVTRLLTVRHLLGLFDPPSQVPYTSIPFSVVDSPAHRSLALEAARESLVLLKNESGFLPLKKAHLAKVAVIGPMAGACHLGGYSGSPAVRISPYAGIAKLLGAAEFRPSLSAADMVAGSRGVQLQASSEGETNLGYIANGAWAEFPRQDFTGKTEFTARVSSAAQGGRIEVHLDKLDGPLACTLTVPHTGDWQKWVDVSAPLAGIAGEHVIYLLFRGGAGYLLNVERFQLDPVVAAPAHPGRPQVVLAPGCSVMGPRDENMFQAAVDAARNADMVVMVCGVDQQVDAEGHDRNTFGLTGEQPALIRAVYAVNPKVVLVLSTNNSVAIEWEEGHLPAILCAVCAGQAQGTAIAEALFGEYNPGGKLPCTWYRSLNQLPPFHDYDISKGRTYLYFAGAPLYPFGHGASYTTFRFHDLNIGTSTLGPNEQTSISMTVANTGDRAGSEVVQVYVEPPESPVKRPFKQLVGFQRVELQPGERKKVVFELPYEEQAFWYWDQAAGRFVIQPGTARILIGNSSANILLAGEITLKASASIVAEPAALTSVAMKSTVL